MAIEHLLPSMRSSTFILTFLLILLLRTAARCADTNILLIPVGDNRAGAVYFMDECVTRGLTNSISVSALRAWATNIIQHHQQQMPSEGNSYTNAKRFPPIPLIEVPPAIRFIQNQTPSCRSAEPLPMPQDKRWDDAVESLSKAWEVSKDEAEARLRTINPSQDQPTVNFWRSASGTVEAVTISWDIYGVIVGPEWFEPKWQYDPWYHRKLADGIYLWHGYR